MIKLLKKSAKFVWDDTCEQNFNTLKQLLTTPPILTKQLLTNADILSKLASTKKKRRYKSLLQHTLSIPSIEQTNQCLNITTAGTWMEPFVTYLEEGTTPANEDKGWARKAARYILVEGELFRRGFSRPLLKCITREQAEYVMQEIHHGICGYHSGPKTMATRIL